MAESFGKFLGKEALAFGKTGFGIVTDFIETGVNETGRRLGHKNSAFKAEL